jgi:putative transposase
MRALAHICRYKPSYSHLGVQGEWLPSGLPKLIKLDRAKANKARDVIRAGCNLGIEFSFDEPRNPKKRPHIERFFGVVKTDFISKLPGAVGHSVSVRPERRALAAEMLATDELDRRFILWVCNRYANHAARTRTHSPRAAWLNYQTAHPGWSPDTASSEEELDRELRVSITRSARSEGLVWEDVPYNGPAIQKIRSDRHVHSHGNPEVEMRMHPDEPAQAQ